jgi:hypothetical protein
VFGFVAASALAEQFVMPLWNLLKIHPVGDALKAKLIADDLAMLLIVLILALTLLILSWRHRKTPAG